MFPGIAEKGGTVKEAIESPHVLIILVNFIFSYRTGKTADMPLHEALIIASGDLA